MGIFSSRSKPADAPSVPDWRAHHAPLIRRAEFHAYPVGDHLHALLPCAGEAPVFCPSHVVDFLYGCWDFQPLEVHLRRFAEIHQLDGLGMDAVRAWLPNLFEARLLRSAEDLRTQCVAIRDGEEPREPARIASICFPTGNRLHLLRRAVTSFVLNGQKFGREVEYVVSDGAATSEGRADCRALLREMGREHGARVAYAGEEEKRRFVRALARETGCDPAIPEFALFDVEGCGFACGANRNASLLHNAGRPFCTVDDDVICQLATAPEARDTLSIFGSSDPREVFFYAGREDLLQSVGMVEKCFVAAHEELLGRSGAACIAAAVPPAELDFSRIDQVVTQRLESGRVLATFTGHFGDLGVPTSYYYLNYTEGNFARLTASEAHYRTVLRSRTVHIGARNPSIGDITTSCCLAAGLDLRELLPPFFPVLHSEDFAFGMTCWQTCAHFPAAHLPFAMSHEPGPGRPILAPGDLQPGRGPWVGVFEFVVLLRSFIATMPPLAAHLATADRMRALGRHLHEIGSAPAADFRAMLRQRVLDLQSLKVTALEARLTHEPEAPEYWARDVEAYLDYTRAQLREEDFDVPHDLRSRFEPPAARALMQRLICRYGALLQAWPELFSAAQRLRENGEPLATPA